MGGAGGRGGLNQEGGKGVLLQKGGRELRLGREFPNQAVLPTDDHRIHAY